MFYPFRELSDLRDEHESWWSSYLRKRDRLVGNPQTSRTLENIQNFYEIFCQSGDVCDEDNGGDSSETDGEDAEPLDAESNSSDDLDEDLVSLDKELALLKDHEQNTIHPPEPFVELLKTINAAPCTLNPQPTSCHVSPTDVRIAIEELAKPRNATFTLQNGNTSNAITSDNDPTSLITDEFQSVGTRVELAEKIFEALRTSKHIRDNENSFLETKDKFNQKTPFPTLQEHSQRWQLNEKQHSAFILCGAALLQHIYNNREDSSTTAEDERAQQLDEQLRKRMSGILPSNGKLLMHLAGSGGTGKSLVVKALVDFAECWKAAQSVVIKASSGVAAMLIGNKHSRKAEPPISYWRLYTSLSFGDPN